MAFEDHVEFPIMYTIKVVGDAAPDFAELVFQCVFAHAPDTAQQPQVKDSSKGSFVSVNVTFEATHIEQLHAIHVDLNATGRARMIL
ncbi:MAG: DUF493 family protein [Pseudomonadales bacterium]